MYTLEVWQMALDKEREANLSPRRLERSRHVQEAMARSAPSQRFGGGLLQRVRHVAPGALGRWWTGPGFRRGAGEPCATLAKALVAEAC